MKYIILLSLLIITGTQTQAKVWRINSNIGVTADFDQGAAAISSLSVVNGDTLYFEPSTNNYQGFTLSKRLVLIGTGYFLSGTNGNPGLQADPTGAYFGNATILLDSTGSGSTLMGLNSINIGIGPNLGSATDNITVTRCYIGNIGQYYGYTANTKMTGWVINKCYISSFGFNSQVLENWQITNNIINSSASLGNTGNFNLLIRNNVIRSSVDLYSAYFSNNIVTFNLNTTYMVNTTIKNNISTGNNLPAGNGNLNGQSDAALFQGLTGNSTDGQWRLKPGSAAIGAGETIAGITPDCGAFGTADPYVLSGIPAIPAIYALTVPASVPSNATSMQITISTRSNN